MATPTNVSQQPHLAVVPGGPGTPLNVSQQPHLSVVATGSPVNVSQAVHITVAVVGEYTPQPGDSFGPVIWYEFDSPDGTTKVWALTDLPDPPTYYGGFKEGLVMDAGVITRALSSDDDGVVEGQRMQFSIDDTARYMRNLLGQTDQRRMLVNHKVRLRMIDDAGRRALLTPRTVAMAVVRGYTTG